MSDVHALTGAMIISSRCYLFKAINIHQRLISQRLSYRKLRNCITLLTCWQDIKPHIAKEWKQKNKIHLQLSCLKMMAWSIVHSLFNFLRIPKLNLGQITAAELEKWHWDRCSAYFMFTKCLCCKSLKVSSKLDLIYAWSGSYSVYSNANKVKWMNS